MLKGPAPPTTLFQSLTTPNTSGSTSNQVPTLAEFRVPSNLVEHNPIVARLMEGESLHAEAELTIATRKTAFNKALREYKKECVKIRVCKRK